MSVNVTEYESTLWHDGLRIRILYWILLIMLDIRQMDLSCVQIFYVLSYIIYNVILYNISLIMHQKYDMQLELCWLKMHTDPGREAYINHGVTFYDAMTPKYPLGLSGTSNNPSWFKITPRRRKNLRFRKRILRVLWVRPRNPNF